MRILYLIIITGLLSCSHKRKITLVAGDMKFALALYQDTSGERIFVEQAPGAIIVVTGSHWFSGNEINDTSFTIFLDNRKLPAKKITVDAQGNFRFDLPNFFQVKNHRLYLLQSNGKGDTKRAFYDFSILPSGEKD